MNRETSFSANTPDDVSSKTQPLTHSTSDTISEHILSTSTYKIEDLITLSKDTCKDERFKLALLWYIQTKVNTYIDDLYISDYELSSDDLLIKTDDEFIYENNILDIKRLLLCRFIRYINHLRSGEKLTRCATMTIDFNRYDKLYGDLLYLACSCINLLYQEIDDGAKHCPVEESFGHTSLDISKHYPLCMSMLDLMANYAYIMLVSEKKRFICLSPERMSAHNDLLCVTAARVLKNYYVRGVLDVTDRGLMHAYTIDAEYVKGWLLKLNGC